VLRYLFSSPRRAGIITAILVVLALSAVTLDGEERIQREIEGVDLAEVGALEDAEALAKRYGQAGPWWSPQRYLYRAVEAEVDTARDLLVLTFERDLSGLVWLLLLDLSLGALYGSIVSMIVAVLRGPAEGRQIPGSERSIPPPPVAPSPGSTRRA
jgi:hypothetical protein